MLYLNVWKLTCTEQDTLTLVPTISRIKSHALPNEYQL
jgi:hypothetical protein